MKAVILTVGDELLIGQVVNTNAAWIGERLTRLGIQVIAHLSIGDDLKVIQDQLDLTLIRSDVVMITGGLGPTHDDVTKNAVAEYFGVDLVFNEEVLEQVQARFRVRNRVMPESVRSQALVPDTFEALRNAVGTAPGLWKQFMTSEGQAKVVVVLPGVPYEMQYLCENEVFPRLVTSSDRQIISQETILTTGLGESVIQEKLGDLSVFLSSQLKLAFLPSPSGVRLRINSYGSDQAESDERLNGLKTHIVSCISDYIYGYNEDTLEGVVGQLLTDHGKTIAVAESCTGGFVLNRITNVSGSSSYVLGGVIAYCNQVKINMLGVDDEALEREGAVSEVVARQMARGVRERFRSSIGISTTGIAGPTGGTIEKPVGTVWVGFSDENGESAFLLHLAHDRLLNKELTSTAVLGILRKKLKGIS